MTSFIPRVSLLFIAIFWQPGYVLVAQEETGQLVSSDIAIKTYNSSIRELNTRFVELAEKELAAVNGKIRKLAKRYRENAGAERDKLVEKLKAERQQLKADDKLAEALRLDAKIASYEKLKHSPPISGAELIRRKSSNLRNDAAAPSEKALTSMKEELDRLKDELAMARNQVSARFTFVGPVLTEQLKPGVKLHTNRERGWQVVPPSIEGWLFTKHAIRKSITYEIEVLEEGYVTACYETYGNQDRPKAFFDDGWTRITEWKMGVHLDNPSFVVVRKVLPVGRHKIPLGHPNSGTILVFPPVK